MKKPKIVFAMFFMVVFMSMLFMGFASASTINAMTNAKGAIADWTVGDVTISATFLTGTQKIASQGQPIPVTFLAITVHHPFGDSDALVMNPEYVWKENYAAVSANAVPFSITSTRGTTTCYLDLTIQWQANSHTIVGHLKDNIDSSTLILNEPMKSATASLTITRITSPIPSLVSIHEGNFPTDQAVILRAISITQSK